MGIRLKWWGRTLQCGFVSLLGVMLLGSAQARADVVGLSLSLPTSVQAGASGSFDVLLTDGAGGTGVDIEAFSFGVQSGSADVTFTDANTSAAPYSYIFRGDSFADTATGGDLGPSISSLVLIAGDVTANGAAVTLSGGETVSLGEVLFTVSPTAPTEMVAISFDTSFAATSLSDQYGNSVPISSFAGGTIDITGAHLAVPEPSSLAGLLSVLLVLVLYRRKAGFRRS